MTAKQKAGCLARAIMDKNEWDFKQIPADQLEACFCYEYGRELARQSPELKKLISMVKTRSASSNKDADEWEDFEAFRKIRNTLSEQFGAFPIVLPGLFPDTCWAGIDTKLRLKTVEEFKTGLAHYERGRRYNRLTIKILRESESLDIHALRDLAYHHDPYSFEALDQTAYGGIAINFSYSDAEITATFKQLLKGLREQHKELRFPILNRAFSQMMTLESKPPELFKYRKKGRGGHRDKLRWLGAMRVVSYYSQAELSDYPDSNLKVDAPYSHLPDLYEAAKKARGLLDQIRRSDGAV